MASSGAKLVTLTVAKARTSGELAQTAKSIGQELGAGGFKELVEESAARSAAGGR